MISTALTEAARRIITSRITRPQDWSYVDEERWDSLHETRALALAIRRCAEYYDGDWSLFIASGEPTLDNDVRDEGTVWLLGSDDSLPPSEKSITDDADSFDGDIEVSDGVSAAAKELDKLQVWDVDDYANDTEAVRDEPAEESDADIKAWSLSSTYDGAKSLASRVIALCDQKQKSCATMIEALRTASLLACTSAGRRALNETGAKQKLVDVVVADGTTRKRQLAECCKALAAYVDRTQEAFSSPRREGDSDEPLNVDVQVPVQEILDLLVGVHEPTATTSTIPHWARHVLGCQANVEHFVQTFAEVSHLMFGNEGATG